MEPVRSRRKVTRVRALGFGMQILHGKRDLTWHKYYAHTAIPPSLVSRLVSGPDVAADAPLVCEGAHSVEPCRKRGAEEGATLDPLKASL
jgi:hypothetical protein